MKSAQTTVSSVRITMTSPMGFTMTGVAVTKPRRAHMVMTGPFSIELYLDGDLMYQKIGTTAWKKQELPPKSALMDFAQTMLDGTRMAVGDDVVDNGVSYGTIAFDFDPAKMLPGAPQMPSMNMTCEYDKHSYLMHLCKNDLFVQTFDHYNDPANVIDIPAEALAAVDAGPIAIPGIASPAPVPSATSATPVPESK